jgi:hypothetical protein
MFAASMVVSSAWLRHQADATPLCELRQHGFEHDHDSAGQDVRAIARPVRRLRPRPHRPDAASDSPGCGAWHVRRSVVNLSSWSGAPGTKQVLPECYRVGVRVFEPGQCDDAGLLRGLGNAGPVTHEPGPFRGKIGDPDGELAIPGRSMVSGKAESHLGIAVQSPFPLARLRTKIGCPSDKGGVKRLCPTEIGHAQVQYRACEFEFHQPTLSGIRRGCAGVSPSRSAAGECVSPQGRFRNCVSPRGRRSGLSASAAPTGRGAVTKDWRVLYKMGCTACSRSSE